MATSANSSHSCALYQAAFYPCSCLRVVCFRQFLLDGVNSAGATQHSSVELFHFNALIQGGTRHMNSTSDACHLEMAGTSERFIDVK